MFSKDGEEEFGAVRDILTDGHLVVNVENKGDMLIPLGHRRWEVARHELHDPNEI